MSELLDLALRAHGGLDRWRKFSKVGATIVSGGGLLPMKGSELPRSPAGTATIATTREQSTVISSFGQSDWRMVFRPDQVLVKTTAGSFVQERRNPRVAFAGHTLTTPWDLLHRAYFSGYARWTYLNTPFLLAMPGVEVAEIAPWQEGTELWRGLRARFPDGFAGHSREQDFYFGDDFLLRRHDYRLEVAGDVAVAQYVSEIVEADGFRFPAKRRAYVRGPQLRAIRDLLLISLNLSDFRLMNEGLSELECCPDTVGMTEESGVQDFSGMRLGRSRRRWEQADSGSTLGLCGVARDLVPARSCAARDVRRQRVVPFHW